MTDAFAATVEAVEDVHPDIRIIRIRPDNKTVSWLAGQYMELVFAGMPARPYSIASAPHTNIFEFHIRNAKGGGVSEHIVKALKTGDKLTLRGPFGSAATIPGDKMPLLLIAGGMGLSPLKALIEDALHRNRPGPITLYWGVKTKEDLYLAKTFEAMAKAHPHFKFIPVIQDKTGRQVGDAVAADFKDLSATRIYLAGSPAMIASILPQLQKNGAQDNFIHGDDTALSRAPKGPA